METVAARFTLIITGLRVAISMFLSRRDHATVVWLGTQAYVPVLPPQTIPPIPGETWFRLDARLGRLITRFASLFARWKSSTLPTPCTPRPGRPARPATPRLPTRRTWIVAHVGYTAAGRARQLEALFADPEMAEFAAAAPQAGRILRPLCHMLGIAPPAFLRLPQRPRPPRPPKPRSTPPLPAPPDRPLPAYVRAAVRAWKPKFG